MSRLFISSLVLLALFHLTTAQYSPLSHILRDKNSLEFYYDQANEDIGAANSQGKLSAKEEVWSSQLSSTIAKIQLDLAKKYEDLYLMQQDMAAVQQHIKAIRNVQRERNQVLAEMENQRVQLERTELEEEKVKIANEDKIFASENLVRRLRERKTRIKGSIHRLTSLIQEANLELKGSHKSKENKKSSLSLIAERLMMEENKAGFYERQGELADSRRDDSMNAFGKALLLSNKASALRKEMERDYEGLQKERVNEDNVIDRLKLDKRNYQHKFEDLARVRQQISSVRSEGKKLEEERGQISKELETIKAVVTSDKTRINELSRRNLKQVMVQAMKQILSRSHRLGKEISGENNAMEDDARLRLQLNRAAAMHAASSQRLDQAAKDAVDSAARLLAATSTLRSIASQQGNTAHS